ncbi:hypothetical protein [Jiella sonneratiae]|uniref:DUF748 domain-containing protein n=1 Tax=Jiella sonneratiae TaxID=2816856 RepID=A0ABS3J176_9HYPH|nr:hypothetical protein [Jiella sonneratiae]MBO0903426.1 hypothetical protein [Jiella sonneratiae]
MTRSFAALLPALVVSATTATVPALSQTAPTPVPLAADPQGLAGLVLPYTPYLFDFAVTSLRTLAQITYSGRRYDPITRSLVVTGLEVDRDAVHFRVGQLRLSTDQMILDDVSVDTRRLSLDPTTAAVLTRLGKEVVTGTVTVDFDLDAPRADYLVQATARLDGIGALELNADLRGFHFLAPLSDIEGAGAAPGRNAPELRGQLATADAAFTDMGLVPALYDVLGKSQGLSPEGARSAATVIAGAGVAGMFDKLPGGATPALQERAQAFSAAVQAFLKNPDRLLVSFRPQQPFDLARLTDGTVDAADVEALNPQVATGETLRQPLLAPAALTLAPDAPLASVLALAETLLEGRGTPQNAGRALELIMPAAMDGNRAAVALLARAIAVDPYVTIAQEKLAPSYVALDLALAEGLPFAAESLTAIGARLSPAEIVGAEDDAVAAWRQTPVGQRQRAAEIEAFRTRDWASIRQFAYAYYEGAEMPRNIMRAYGWASIAAAGGDRVAAKLRDELTRAAGSGKLVLPLDRARKATDDLWALILGGDKPAEPAATGGDGDGGGTTKDGGAAAGPGGSGTLPRPVPGGGAGSSAAPTATQDGGSAAPGEGTLPEGGTLPGEGGATTPSPQPPQLKGKNSGETVTPAAAPAAFTGGGRPALAAVARQAAN